MNENAVEALSIELGRHLERVQWSVTTAESCTGGLIAGAITDVAGSSNWFRSGLVTYSNEAKQSLLGVEASVFEVHGAVSEACVTAMASGALQSANANVAISVSGIAGPGGASVGKPVGTVWIGWAIRSASVSETDVIDNTESSIDAEIFQFSGDRRRVRQQAVYQALRGTILRINNAGIVEQ